MEPKLAGVFPVLSTPFLDAGGCDHAGARALVRHVHAAGADGAVYPGVASEFATLAPDERRQMVATVLSEAKMAGLPMIIGVSAATVPESAAFARQAGELGAVAVMAMAPGDAVGRDAVSAFMAAVADAFAGPVIMQNAGPPLGSSLAVDLVTEVAHCVPSIRYIKEENVPCGQRISQLLARRPASLLGVMGGAGGRFVLDEYARGACGSMPSCEAVEAHAAIWSLTRSGRHAAARAVFNRILPLLNMGGVFRQSVVKHVLKTRGLIASARFRDTNPPLDDSDVIELNAILADIADLLPRVARSAVHEEFRAVGQHVG